jgi:hypothetical protein
MEFGLTLFLINDVLEKEEFYETPLMSFRLIEHNAKGGTMAIDGVLVQKELDSMESKKFSSKTFYLFVFMAFLFGVGMTLTYRPDFGNLAYEVTGNDFLLAQTKCIENGTLKSLLVNPSRAGYQLNALCQDGSSFSW